MQNLGHCAMYLLYCLFYVVNCMLYCVLDMLCCRSYATICVLSTVQCMLCVIYCVIGMLYIVDCMLNIFHCLMLVVIYAWFISIGQPFNFQIIYYSKVHNIQLCLICWSLCIGYQILQIVHRTSYDAGLLYVAYCIMDMVVVSCMILLYPVSSELHVVHCSFHKF